MADEQPARRSVHIEPEVLRFLLSRRHREEFGGWYAKANPIGPLAVARIDRPPDTFDAVERYGVRMHRDQAMELRDRCLNLSVILTDSRSTEDRALASLMARTADRLTHSLMTPG